MFKNIVKINLLLIVLLYSSIVFSYDINMYEPIPLSGSLLDSFVDMNRLLGYSINPSLLDKSQLFIITPKSMNSLAQTVLLSSYNDNPYAFENEYLKRISQIDEQLSQEEAQIRYKAIYNSTCLTNPLYRKIHFLIDHDDKIVQDDKDTLFTKWAVLENGIITDYKEDAKTLGYGWKRIYATLNNPIKEGAIKNTHITHLLTEDNCEFDTESVINNKNLKFVLIQSEITNIDEDAFRDNPNILVYHVCGAKYYSNVHKYDLDYMNCISLSCCPEIAYINNNGKLQIVDNKLGLAGKPNVIKGNNRKTIFYYLKPYTKYIDINGVLFTKNGLQLLFYPIGKKDQSYKVPDGVTYIGNSAFRSAKNLKTVTIPASVDSIGDEAFFGTNLTLFVKKGSYAETFAKEHKIKIKNY